MVRNQRPLQTLGVAEQLLERSRDHWHGDPLRSESLAELGLEVVDLLDEEVYGAAPINDLRARAWAYVANARRIRSNLRSVEEAFRAAEFYLERGTGAPAERAAVLSLEASLYRDQRRFADAVTLLEEASEIFHQVEDRRREIFVLIQKATVLHEAGQQREAIQVLEETLRLFGEKPADEELRLFFYAHHNLVIYLNESGLTAEALRLIPKVRDLACRYGESFDRLRVDWVEGMVLIHTGRVEEGERLLLRVRDRFLREGIGYDAALVSLDLALLYVRTGRTAEAKRLATELLPIFESRDVHREALAAVLILQQALRQENATVALVEEVADYLSRARGNPTIRFSRSVDL